MSIEVLLRGEEAIAIEYAYHSVEDPSWGGHIEWYNYLVEVPELCHHQVDNNDWDWCDSHDRIVPKLELTLLSSLRLKRLPFSKDNQHHSNEWKDDFDNINPSRSLIRQEVSRNKDRQNRPNIEEQWHFSDRKLLDHEESYRLHELYADKRSDELEDVSVAWKKDVRCLDLFRSDLLLCRVVHENGLWNNKDWCSKSPHEKHRHRWIRGVQSIHYLCTQKVESKEACAHQAKEGCEEWPLPNRVLCAARIILVYIDYCISQHCLGPSHERVSGFQRWDFRFLSMSQITHFVFNYIISQLLLYTN